MSKITDDGKELKFTDMMKKAREEGERRGTNEYAKKFSLEVIKGYDAKRTPFTAYICCTLEEKEELALNANVKGVNIIEKFQKSGNIVHTHIGHDVSREEDESVRNYYGYHFLRNKAMKEAFPSGSIGQIISEGKKVVESGVREEKGESSPRLDTPRFHDEKESKEGFGR